MVVIALVAGCATRQRPAPVDDRRARAPAPAQKAEPAKSPAASDVFYTVKRGDTLYSIALEHGADYREVAQWNYLDDPTKLRIGQVLRVKPPDERPGPQIGTVKPPARIEARPLDESKPPVESKPAPSPSVVETKDAQFIWPAKGRVLSAFAEPRSKGIDIDGKPGDPVIAAAAGRVTYTGTGIQGLGKLVVIKHDNGFITVYAHNKEILVKEQQAVTRGQKIAEIGSTDSERPKLHFQIRKGAAAVDPMLYLPKS
ncbi:MAG TPA: peptidoglycan DD-metalloendopeptidase family protein [Burkholderiales bacterium]|nr:peptidoglycan DD-metalloendopeptidase family protein [Burkholderiales bacterium]